MIAIAICDFPVIYRSDQPSFVWFLQVLSMLLNFLLLYIVHSVQSATSDCNQDIVDGSYVSKCSATDCESIFDRIPDADLVEWPTTPNKVVQIISTQKGDRFKIYNHQGISTDEFYYEESHTNVTSFIDTNKKYQRILGFGSTLTDSSCINIDHLPGDIRLKLIQNYFDSSDGIRLNLIRIPIGSNEYSIVNYALDSEGGSQVDLSIYDNDYRIPIILEALEAAGRSRNRLKLLASPTTAPIKFKTNSDLRGGKLNQGSMKSYAEYLNNFLLAYKQSGLNIWSLILGDNSMTPPASTESDETHPSSMTMTPEEVRDLVVAHLGPILKDNVKLLALDDQRKYIPYWADVLFKNETSANLIAGIAYKNEQPAPYDNLIYLTKKYPDKMLLASQSRMHNEQIKLGNWRYAQDYAIEITKVRLHSVKANQI